MHKTSTDQVIFTGRVQGVGFRYSVRSIAKHYSVKGYVRNLADGTVELVMQGAPAAKDSLVAEVAEYFRDNIVDCVRQAIETPEEFAHFEIRF